MSSFATRVGLMSFFLALPPTMGLVEAQDAPDTPKSEPTKGEGRPGPGGPGGGFGARAKPGSYDSVITKEAKSDPGLFLVHRIENKVFYEIPTDALKKDMLWVTQVAATQTGRGYGGTPVGDRVVRWEQRGEDILLRNIRYSIRAEAKDPIQDAVASTSVPEIIEVFPIKAYGKDKAPVIEVTSLFTSDVPEFSAKRQVGGSGSDSRKTFVESVKSFPENIETRVLMTYRPGGGGGIGLGRLGLPTGGGDSNSSGITVLLHHSMVKLPEVPMRPRRYDPRVGYFTETFEDYGDVRNHQVEDVAYITRWRLEKKDPNAEVSEPKKPIVFYIGREVPTKWRPWIKKGVEAWQPAFEKAGFKNAIIAKEAPTAQQDPDWDAEDARYSSIRWLPSKIENAMGPHVHDPRTGEILESDILMYHNVLKLLRDWYFVQVSPNDPRARKLPLPDDLIGEILACVVTHEVGHTLGFRHNMKASSSYTVAQLRDPKFTKENGVEASIMDYGRFNYVAQPGDGARLIPIVGPYDKFAVEWGYKEFPKAKTYEEEKKELEAILSRQVKDPTLRFGDPNPGEDPSQQTEDLGSDAIEATALGLKNIDRVAGFLVEATAKKGEDYSDLENMYSQLLGQRQRELAHVANVVGGFVKNNLFYGDADKMYAPVPAERQREAVKFLLANAFHVPKSLIAPEIVDRIEAFGTAERILGGQRMLLMTLLSENRVRRMGESAQRDPKTAYGPTELLNDLRSGIFSELKSEKVSIDLYRRNLQRAFVETLVNNLESGRANSDLPALARVELRELRTALSAAVLKSDSITKAHLHDLSAKIDEAFQPKPKSASAPPTTRFFPGSDF